ncbi:MAG: hypothetical protein H6Q14_931 [Bacteroidetes bacterium]|nr:hypothetical protein [Bacteroidota bacterium]
MKLISCLTHKCQFKIVVFFFCLLLVQGAFAQSAINQRITIQKANIPLTELLNEIKSKSGYKIFYNSAIVRNVTVSVNATNQAVSEILSKALEGTNLTYSADNGTIVISVKKKVPSPAKDAKEAGRNFHISGVVVDSLDKKPVEMAIVTINELNIWARTDENGKFSLRGIPSGKYSMKLYILGYQEKNTSKEINADIDDFNIKLSPLSLSLKEVSVTASEVKFGSVSKIGSEAIEHIQAKSLTDIFQLLPGQVTQNPSLAKQGQVQIRELYDRSTGKQVTDNSALGTVVIIDGAQISNNSNMQTFSTARAGNLISTPVSTAGKGPDIREISADNIESVEVIKGIPSSEYGDLTTGVVIIKTKIGEQPWTVKSKIDPCTKIGSIYRGIKLRNQKGIVNGGFDYAQAYDDMRYKSNGYKRLTGTFGYSQTFFGKANPLDVNIRFSYHQTIDNNKSDPQQKQNEVYRSSENGYRWGFEGKWLLRKSWITMLEYNLTGDYATSESYVKQLQVLASGVVPYPTSYVDGVFAADYLPGEYYAEYTNTGKPWNVFAKLKGTLSKQMGDAVNTFISGVEVKINGNSGEGLKYDLSRPPFLTLASSIRPRAYKDIPSLKTYSLFVEDKITKRISSTKLTSQLGMRLTKVEPRNFFRAEPRWNTEYQLLNKNNNSLLDKLCLNWGWGIAYKMPTLSYISPDKAYFDDVSFNSYDTSGSLAVITTKTQDTSNPNLKPAQGTKNELGFSLEKKGVSVSVTGYYEKLKNGFTFSSLPYFSVFQKFTIPEGAGKTPVLENGQVYYYENGEKIAATTTMDTTIYTYNSPANNQVVIKKGIEYVVNVAKINSIRTSFVIDGAWIYQNVYKTTPSYSKVSTTDNAGNLYQYLAVMPGGYKQIMQRFNTNVRMITHVPELKMIVSLATQIVWSDREKNRWDDADGNSLVYYYDGDGNRMYGEGALKRMDQTRYVDPIGFFDKAGAFHEWKTEYSTDSKYSAMLSNFSNYYFVEENLPPAVQFNLRLTKEFSRNFALAFMTNNFLKMNPIQKSNKTGLYTSRNTDFYFGAELNYKF